MSDLFYSENCAICTEKHFEYIFFYQAIDYSIQIDYNWQKVNKFH